MSLPAPASRDSWLPRTPGLGETQREMLGALREHGAMTLAQLGQLVDRNRETLRHHMRSLAERGLVERAESEPDGRGRPEVVYQLASGTHDLFPQRERQVLRELVEFLLERGDADQLEAFFARRAERKRRLAEKRLKGLAGERRMQEVASFLTEEGFLARIEKPEGGVGREVDTLRIVHCPLEGLVDATRLPCRAELDLVAELLGRPLSRLEFMPAGGRTCSYAIERADEEAP